VRPTNSIPQLRNGFFQEILGRMHTELEVVGFILEQEREGGPSQSSNVMTIKVLDMDNSHLYLIFKAINSASPKSKVRVWSTVYCMS
jgi:hypothetical protein